MTLTLTFTDTGSGVDMDCQITGEETATEQERQLCLVFQGVIARKMEEASKLAKELEMREKN